MTESTPTERSEQIRVELGFAPGKWAAMNRQQRRAAARRYRARTSNETAPTLEVDP